MSEGGRYSYTPTKNHLCTPVAEVQGEVAAAAAATDPIKLEAVRGGRFFIEAFKEAIYQFSADDVAMIQGKHRLGEGGRTCARTGVAV